MLKYALILVGFMILTGQMLHGVFPALAFQPSGTSLVPVAATSSGGSLSPLGGYLHGETTVQAPIVLSGTFFIQSYPPLGTMVVTTTQHLSGSFPANPYFFPCSNASGLAFSSTGGTCTWNVLTQRINCPTGITSFTFSYACASTPVINGTRLTVSLTSDWDAGPIDRTWDFAYSPLIYHSATILPDTNARQVLRWTQIDEPRMSFDVSFIDPRVTLLFLPLVRK